MNMSALLKIFEKEDLINNIVKNMSEDEKLKAKQALAMIINKLSGEEDEVINQLKREKE